jgi:chromosomal replication initiation ATPase DnaA
MNMHNTELAKQASKAADIRKRLMGVTEKAAVQPPPAKPEKTADLHMQIYKLNQRIRALEAVAKAKVIADKRIKELELDLSDSRARILAQAELLRPNEEFSSEPTVRPVRVIVDDVLRDFPGVTFQDVKSLRRTKDLIIPRHACIKAVFDERRDLSSVTIGKIFGNRDHSTILASVQKSAGHQ